MYFTVDNSNVLNNLNNCQKNHDASIIENLKMISIDSPKGPDEILHGRQQKQQESNQTSRVVQPLSILPQRKL